MHPKDGQNLNHFSSNLNVCTFQQFHQDIEIKRHITTVTTPFVYLFGIPRPQTKGEWIENNLCHGRFVLRGEDWIVALSHALISQF